MLSRYVCVFVPPSLPFPWCAAVGFVPPPLLNNFLRKIRVRELGWRRSPFAITHCMGGLLRKNSEREGGGGSFYNQTGKCVCGYSRVANMVEFWLKFSPPPTFFLSFPIQERR
jgi:hypothetical protein